MSFINVEIANRQEWNAVQPVAEMMGGPKPRCLNPGLQFKVSGLEDLKVYTAGVVFTRSCDRFNFSKDSNCWVQWKTGIERFAEQKFVMEPSLGGDLGEIDFSKMTMTTNEKSPVKDDQIIVHTHHIYRAALTITDEETQETMYFHDDRLQFVVVTNSNPRYKSQKECLDALQEPEKMAKKAKKEEQAQKRAEKKLKRPAPAPEYVNKYKHLIGTEQFEKMKPRFIIRRDPPAEPPAKRQRVEEEAQVVQPAPQPVYPVADEPEFAPVEVFYHPSLYQEVAHQVVNAPEFATDYVFYDPNMYQVVDEASGSGTQSPWNYEQENVPPMEYQQNQLVPVQVGQVEEKDAKEEKEFLPLSPSQFDMNSGAIVVETTSGYIGNFATENWREW